MRLIDADLLMENLGFMDTEEEREENVGQIITWEDVDRMPTAFEADAVKARCYCGECKRKIKSFLCNEAEEQERTEAPEQPEGWKARMLEKFQKRV